MSVAQCQSVSSRVHPLGFTAFTCTVRSDAQCRGRYRCGPSIMVYLVRVDPSIIVYLVWVDPNFIRCTLYL